MQTSLPCRELARYLLLYHALPFPLLFQYVFAPSMFVGHHGFNHPPDLARKTDTDPHSTRHLGIIGKSVYSVLFIIFSPLFVCLLDVEDHLLRVNTFGVFHFPIVHLF
jgi:hypothetical protein